MSFTEVRTDPLTGLSNRRAMEETLSRMFALQSRYGTTFALAIVDIDHFKDINDEHGHLHGDHMLVQFAGKLEETAAAFKVFEDKIPDALRIVIDIA